MPYTLVVCSDRSAVVMVIVGRSLRSDNSNLIYCAPPPHRAAAAAAVPSGEVWRHLQSACEPPVCHARSTHLRRVKWRRRTESGDVREMCVQGKRPAGGGGSFVAVTQL